MIETMDEETKIMLEVQTKMLDMMAQYPPERTEAVIAMCFKLVLDCYVERLGESDTTSLLQTAMESVRSGNHGLMMARKDTEKILWNWVKSPIHFPSGKFLSNRDEKPGFAGFGECVINTTNGCSSTTPL